MTPGARTTAIAAEQASLVPVYSQLALEPLSASGVTIHCRQGDYLDFYGGHAVAALGYDHPRIVEALTAQAHTLMFQSNSVALDVRARAARKLLGFGPANLGKAFLVNSGAEANENALRLAVRATGRPEVLALRHGFHGRTAAAGAVTWGAKDRWYGFPRTPFDVVFAPRDDAVAAADMIGERTAAVILELVQGVAGAYDLDKDFVRAVAAACQSAGALLIVDEVQSGMGRSGAPFAAQQYGIAPDILTAAKSLGAGFPCGAVMLTDTLSDQLHVGDLGTTFGGGPLACALIETVIDVIQEQDLLASVRDLSAQMRERCVVGPVTGVQGCGFLLGLQCARPAREIAAELLQHGIITGTSADPAVLRLLPPLVLQQNHVDQLVEALSALPGGPQQ